MENEEDQNNQQAETNITLENVKTRLLVISIRKDSIMIHMNALSLKDF